MHSAPTLPWLQAGERFPDADTAWGPDAPIPGLVAAGGSLDTTTLLQAYRGGLFPWFSAGQPILWWSPNPRMVLNPSQFRLHASLRKTLRSQLRQGRLEVRIDTAFDRVIESCAQTPRPGQQGTWIVPPMVAAYRTLHRDGHAHSVETWWDGELAGGLYCVSIGHMVFGESMFSRRSNASKIALAGLVACCQAWGVRWIDCQQNTSHLARLGGGEIPRSQFLDNVRQAIAMPAPTWQFNPLYWQPLLDAPVHRTGP